MNKKFERFYRLYLWVIPRCENRKQAWYLTERIWKRRTGERYYVSYSSFRKNMSYHLRKRDEK